MPDQGRLTDPGRTHPLARRDGRVGTYCMHSEAARGGRKETTFDTQAD